MKGLSGEEDLKKASKRRGGGIFWSITKILFVFIFIAGIIVGIYACHYLVEPYWNGPLQERITLLETKSVIQNEQINSYLNCLQNNNIDLNSCQS